MWGRQAGRQTNRHHERVWRKDSSKWRCGEGCALFAQAARLIDRQSEEERGRGCMCDMPGGKQLRAWTRAKQEAQQKHTRESARRALSAEEATRPHRPLASLPLVGDEGCLEGARYGNS